MPLHHRAIARGALAQHELQIRVAQLFGHAPHLREPLRALTFGQMGQKSHAKPRTIDLNQQDPSLIDAGLHKLCPPPLCYQLISG